MGFGEAWARLAILYIVVLVALLGLSMVLELWDCSCWFSIVVTYPWFRCFRVPFSFLLFSFSSFSLLRGVFIVSRVLLFGARKLGPSRATSCTQVCREAVTRIGYVTIK